MKLKLSKPSFGVDLSLDSRHCYETSWLLPPLPFALLRALIALYIFVTIFFIWGWDGTHNNSDAIGQSFSYFTWLTYWGLGFYFLVAAIHTACYARTGRSVIFDRLPCALRVLHALFYTTITTFPFLVTIVFWAILFKPPWYTVTFEAWSNVYSPFSFKMSQSERVSLTYMMAYRSHSTASTPSGPYWKSSSPPQTRIRFWRFPSWCFFSCCMSRSRT
jgi:hypothetical protein